MTKNSITIHSFTNPFMDLSSIIGSFNMAEDYTKLNHLPNGIKKVIFQKQHTIIVWSDETKTCVKCSEEDFDREKGLAMAICKKLMDRNKFKKLIVEADIQDK